MMATINTTASTEGTGGGGTYVNFVSSIIHNFQILGVYTVRCTSIPLARKLHSNVCPTLLFGIN
jgi:hypothetical protein